MKTRHLVKMFLLQIVTLGIYRLYWFIKTREEMMKTNPQIKIMSPWVLVAPILSVPFLLILILVFAAVNADAASLILSLLIYPLFFAIFVIYVIWVWSYAQGVEKVSNDKLGFALTLIVLLVVPDGIDILIVQDTFNKLAVAAPVGPAVAPAMAAPVAEQPAVVAGTEPMAADNPTAETPETTDQTPQDSAPEAPTEEQAQNPNPTNQS